MIAYTMVGTHNLERALHFYAPLFSTMELDVCWQDDSCVSFGDPDDVDVPRFFVGLPFNGYPASAGNGSMTAFQFADPKEVDTLYQLAIHNGGSDEGAPGYRPQYGAGFYSAYVRDPDGNKLAFVVYPHR
ncbi:VOC family protein [Halomonas qinghailakensis]|uniref:VOC family protein n=1 Tax=Halomonas qinghailakensis TaxID=2937790 RepID=A0AA46TNP2_9GAMM|nr:MULTISPECIES: VOC family protein [Halomonas]UYO73684.1 VOC family protein [Halomonas sp. ZZQ-149]